MLTFQSLYLLAAQTAIVTIIITLLFLPAIIELKRPKDSGPRLINENVTKMTLSALKIAILNIEEEGPSTINFAGFLSQLLNLET